MSRAEELTKKQKITNKLAQFIQSKRIILVILGLIIISGLLAIAVLTKISDTREESAMIISEEMNDNYAEWRNAEEDRKTELEDEISEKMDVLEADYKTYFAYQKGSFIAGLLYFEKEEYESAAEKFIEVVNQGPEGYLAPVSLFNYSVCKEESGDYKAAMEGYERIYLEYSESYVSSKALFSAGRVAENSDNNEEAEKYYNLLVDTYPNSNWTNIARSRIIFIKTNK